jgi:tetratricopeptide (TPR) repeat protein
MNARLVIFVMFSFWFVRSNAQDKPKKAYELHEEAEAAYNDGRYKVALQKLDECLKINPAYYEAYPLRAAVREQLKDNDGALVDYSIYLEKFPTHSEVLMNRAMLRYRIGFYEQSKEDFTALLKLPVTETNSVFYKRSMTVGDRNPMLTTSQGGHKAQVYNYLGLNDAKLKNFQLAKADFDTAIILDGKEADFFVNRGLAKEALNDSTALEDYRAALKLNPYHTLAQHNLSALLAKKNPGNGKEDRLTRTIEADSTMLLPYLERAQQRFESKYYDGAIEDYTMALEIDSTNVDIWLGRGLAREKLKDFKGAFSDYTRAIGIRENYVKAWINRGNVLMKLERYHDAIEDYTVALVYNSSLAAAYFNRGMAKVKLKDNAGACPDIKKAEELGMAVDQKVKSKVCD